MEPAPSLTQVLVDTQSENVETRRNAEAQLLSAEASNFGAFIEALGNEVANETKSETVRQIAGLLLKNSISGVDPKIDAQKRNKWAELDGKIQQEVKTLLLRMLESSVSVVRSTANQVISKIARIDLPTENWPQLLPHLEVLASSNSPAPIRASTHQVLGFICEDIQILTDDVGKEILQDEKKDHILKLLFVGLVDVEDEVKLAALQGFYHGILFADKYMQLESDRTRVFEVIGAALSSPNENVEAAAWEVMLQIANGFYTLLGPYMPQLRDLSLLRIAGGAERSALSAIEFWSTICDEEILIMEGDSRQPFQRYIHTYKDALLPALFEATVQDEFDEEKDDDEWNVAMAAGTSIGLCAQVLKDDILPLALVFIEANFGNPKWNRREAAVMVYGSVLEGPSTRVFGPALQRSFESLCKCLSDESVAVRDTTAWTIARAAKFHLPAVAEYLGTSSESGLISLLLNMMGDEPRVATNICFALYEIVDGVGKLSPTPGLPILDPFFQPIAAACINVAKRSDASEKNLIQNAYHVLYILVKECGTSDEQVQAMSYLLQQLMDWMEQTFVQPPSEEIVTIQGLMCGCLNALIIKLGANVQAVSDRLYAILQKTWGNAAEEALLAMNVLITALQGKFSRYIESFAPLLLQGLQNRDDSELCSIAINIVGNLAASIGDALNPYVQKEVEELFGTLRLSSAPISLKPKAINALSDIATYLPHSFKPCLTDFLNFLAQAARTKINEGPLDSEDWIRYILELRDATLIAYSSCIYCVRDLDQPGFTEGQNQQMLLTQEVSRMLDFIYLVMGDSTSSPSNIKNGLMLTQDLVQHFKANIVSHIRTLPLYTVLRERCAQSNDQEIQVMSMALDEIMAKHSS